MPAILKLPLAAAFAATVMLVCSVSTAIAEPTNGKDIYQKCVNCHGVEGHGVKRFWAPGIAGLSAEYVARQVHNFYDGTRGSHREDIPGHRMRPMARMLKKDAKKSDAMIKAVSDYVAKMKPVVPEQTVANGDSERGQLIYAKVCKACHGANAGGMPTLGPDLRYTGDWYLLAQLKNFQAKRRAGNPAPECNGFTPPAHCDPKGLEMVCKVWPKDGPAVLPDEQSMKDVIAYITRLAESSNK
jgi:cytochrome c oxidase subunit 2